MLPTPSGKISFLPMSLSILQSLATFVVIVVRRRISRHFSITSGWSFPNSCTANSHSSGVGRTLDVLPPEEVSILFLLLPLDASASAILIAAVLISEIDRDDTGVSGSGIDLTFLRAEAVVEDDKDMTGSGEIKDGDLTVCEGLALNRSGRVRALVDLRTPVELLLFFAMVVGFMIVIGIFNRYGRK